MYSFDMICQAFYYIPTDLRNFYEGFNLKSIT